MALDISHFTQEDLETRDAIGVIIRDKTWRILVQDHVKLDFFTVPIGKVKAGEDPEGVMLQELREELGIEVTEYKAVGACVGNYDYDGAIVRIRTHVFEVLAYEWIIENREPKKHRSIAFMEASEVEKLPRISDATRYVLDHLSASH